MTVLDRLKQLDRRTFGAVGSERDRQSQWVVAAAVFGAMLGLGLLAVASGYRDGWWLIAISGGNVAVWYARFGRRRS